MISRFIILILVVSFLPILIIFKDISILPAKGVMDVFDNKSDVLLVSICKVVINKGLGITHRVRSVDTLWCKIYSYSEESGAINGILYFRNKLSYKTDPFYFRELKNFYSGFPDLHILKTHEYFVCNGFDKFVSYDSIAYLSILPGSVAYTITFNDSIYSLKNCPNDVIITIENSVIPPIGSVEIDSFFNVLNALDSRVYFED